MSFITISNTYLGCGNKPLDVHSDDGCTQQGSSKYYVIKRCHQLVWVGVGGQANYDVMMVFCGKALQQHHKTLKISTTTKTHVL